MLNRTVQRDRIAAMIVMIGSAATPRMTRAANPNVAVVDPRPGGSFGTPDKRAVITRSAQPPSCEKAGSATDT
jgi:hypothetical protein